MLLILFPEPPDAKLDGTSNFLIVHLQMKKKKEKSNLQSCLYTILIPK